MKKTIIALVSGIVIGGGTLGPLAATAAENATLRERVEHLEYRLDVACKGAQAVKPAWYHYLVSRNAC